MASVDLLASYYTCAGNIFPSGPTEISPWTFEQRATAAAKAGFAGIGFHHPDLIAVSETIGIQTIKSILADSGLKHLEIEFLTHWYADGPERAKSDRIRSDLMRLGEQLGARHIKVAGDPSKTTWPLEHLASSFQSLCKDANDAGMMVGLELMPYNNINDLDAALSFVSASGVRNGGLLLDLWQIRKCGIEIDRLRDIPSQYVTYVELDDGWESGKADWIETIHRRELCGEGDMDVAKFVQVVRDIGYAGPFGVEILSHELRQLPLESALQRAAETTRQYV